MQENGVLKKTDLQMAMGNVNPPIKFSKANDTVADLIKKIVDSKSNKNEAQAANDIDDDVPLGMCILSRACAVFLLLALFLTYSYTHTRIHARAHTS
jgi:hypothetical protein